MQREITPGVHSSPANPGDVLNFTAGNYDYFTADGMSGTQQNPIIFQFQPGVIFTSGFDMSNVNWLVFDGGTNKNLLIQGASGVPLSFKGKCSNIEVKGIKIHGAYSWIWFKTEVNEGAFENTDYWTIENGVATANYVMDGLKLSNFEFKDASFDGGYIGSTGQNADRLAVIDGVDYYPFPAKVANIQIQDGTMDGSARTGLQISGLASGVNFVKNVTIQNCGKSLEQYQGACFLIGGNSPAGIEVDHCTFDGSNLYAVRTDGGGIIKFTNNTVRNSTLVGGTHNPLPMASVQLDSYDSNPATFIIENNDIDASNNGVSIVVYGDAGSVSSNSIISGNTLAGSFQNFSGVTFKTSGDDGGGNIIPPTVVYFTLDAVNGTSTIYYSDASTVLKTGVRRITGVNTSKKTASWRIYYITGQTEVL